MSKKWPEKVKRRKRLSRNLNLVLNLRKKNLKQPLHQVLLQFWQMVSV